MTSQERLKKLVEARNIAAQYGWVRELFLLNEGIYKLAKKLKLDYYAL